MIRRRSRGFPGLKPWLAAVFALLACSFSIAQKRPLDFPDMMKFRSVQDPVISDDGRWIVLTAQPDRGDGEVLVYSTDGATRYRYPLGRSPKVSSDGRWVAAGIQPSFAEREKLEDCEEKLAAGMAVLDTSTGEWTRYDRVIDFALAEKTGWLAYRLFDMKKETARCEDAKSGKKNGEKDPVRSGRLIVRRLDGTAQTELGAVVEYGFDPEGRRLVCVTAEESETAEDVEGEEEATVSRRMILSVFDLEDASLPRLELASSESERIGKATWSKEAGRLAFVSAAEEDGEGRLWTWRAGDDAARSYTSGVAGWRIPFENRLTWTKDGSRLFFGLKPADTADADGSVEAGEEPDEDAADKGKEETPADPYDLKALLDKREVDVWHPQDPRIIPQQKKVWEDERKRTYPAVLDSSSGRVVQLGDLELEEVETVENPHWTVGRDDRPYRRERTWSGPFHDVYAVALTDGTKRRVAERLRERASLSPGGGYVAYYDQGVWYLRDLGTDLTYALTESLSVSFSDEQHDYPSPAPGYGVVGWLEDDTGVLIYDRFDIWLFPTDRSAPRNLTHGLGRESETVLRLIRVDPESQGWSLGERVLLSSYGEKTKEYGLRTMVLGEGEFLSRLEGPHKYQFLGKADDADRLVITRENYGEFPDLWVGSFELTDAAKVTDVNPQMEEFLWGESELVEWLSLDGIPLQGVLIKPANYEPGKRYPVLVYFYRLFSQRLYEFNQPVVNHRPCFPFYTGNGYAIFLPDIRFEVGRPGFSAFKSLVPGIQKLIDLGVADPEAIGLHGHSWSGYQTAFLVTRTDLFAAALAGAPVSNMTSAYSGIRWGTGLARQFQYEESQSRIGGSLWEYPERYIENSPVFYADRINTPLMLMFGDEDEAVPWYQGIELYLALRRLGKESVFLQYRGEPHHLQKDSNKLDYAIKMKEFFDHYLKGEPSPKWLSEGVPYQGK